MKYQEFKNTIHRAIFRTTDVDFKLLGISSVQLSRWMKAGYILQIKRGLYAFKDENENIDQFVLSALIYEPSYVSLESALSIHNFIPEQVYAVTAVTGRTTRTFTNGRGTFMYRHVSPALLFGYAPYETSSGKYLLAEPEKAILDYIYFNHDRLVSEDDIIEWRINEYEFREKIDKKKLLAYLSVYNSKSMNKSVNMLIKYANL